MKTLSIKQPWASLIALGIKDIENRSWSTNFRGRIYIHASKVPVKGLWNNLNRKQVHEAINSNKIDNYTVLPYEAIIGTVEIVDVVRDYDSIWAEKNQYNWILKNPVLFDTPIENVKGKLLLWDYEKQGE